MVLSVLSDPWQVILRGPSLLHPLHFIHPVREEGRTDEWMKEGKVFVINVRKRHNTTSSPSFEKNGTQKKKNCSVLTCDMNVIVYHVSSIPSSLILAYVCK
jgi:hypothetical protein